MSRINRNVNSLFAWPKMHLNVTDNIVPQGTNLISVNYRFWNAFMYRLTLITLAIPSDSYPVRWDGAEYHRMLLLIIESHPDSSSSTKMTHTKVSLFTFYKQNTFILLGTNCKDFNYRLTSLLSFTQKIQGKANQSVRQCVHYFSIPDFLKQTVKINNCLERGTHQMTIWEDNDWPNRIQ